MRPHPLTLGDARWYLTAHGWRTQRDNHPLRKQRSRRMKKKHDNDG